MVLSDMGWRALTFLFFGGMELVSGRTEGSDTAGIFGRDGGFWHCFRVGAGFWCCFRAIWRVLALFSMPGSKHLNPQRTELYPCPREEGSEVLGVKLPLPSIFGRAWFQLGLMALALSSGEMNGSGADFESLEIGF
jgi:hypothetical protein